MMCNSALQGALNLYRSKNDYRRYLTWSIYYYRHIYPDSKFTKVCQEELERLDRLVDR